MALNLAARRARRGLGRDRQDGGRRQAEISGDRMPQVGGDPLDVLARVRGEEDREVGALRSPRPPVSARRRIGRLDAIHGLGHRLDRRTGVFGAVDDDLFLLAPGDRHALVPEQAEVARPQPAVGREQGAGRLGVAVVARCHRRPAHLHRPDLALGDRSVVFGDDAHGVAAGRPVERDLDLGVAVGREAVDAAGHRAAFGQAVAQDHHVRAQAERRQGPHEAAADTRRNRLGPDAQLAQGCKVPAAIGRGGHLGLDHRQAGVGHRRVADGEPLDGVEP